MINKRENSKIEFKSKYVHSKALKEFAAMLNMSTKEEVVEIFFGFDDDGNITGFDEPQDESKNIDELQRDLSIYGVALERVEHSKNAFSIKAIASNAAIIVDGKLPIRHGSSSYSHVSNEHEYKKILDIKNINLGGLLEKEYNPKDFSKLENYLAKTMQGMSLIKFLEKTGAVLKIGNKIKLTGWSRFLGDDSPLTISIGEELVSGPLFELFETAVEFANKIAKTEEFLIDSRRKRIEENIENWQEVIREIISNMFCHSHFKLFHNSMWITVDKNEITFKNTIVNGSKLKQRIENRSIPIEHHNEIISLMLRLMNLLEGRGIGFDVLFKTLPFIKFEVTNSDIEIKLGGEYD